MYKKELSLAARAAKAAGKIIMDNYENPKVSLKIDKTTLTNVDIECENVISSLIRKKFPDHSFLGEETGHAKKVSEFTWVVDPLDGTTNYTMKNPFFCTSIALVKNSEPVLGVVFNPFTKELFSAAHGDGAVMNKKKLCVSKKGELDSALIAFCHKVDKESVEKINALFPELKSRTHKVRQMGAAALELCYVAAGRADAFLMVSTNPWDVAAGALIVKEAQGVVTDFTAASWNMEKKDIVASNTFLHSHIIDIVKNV